MRYRLAVVLALAAAPLAAETTCPPCRAGVLFSNGNEVVLGARRFDGDPRVYVLTRDLARTQQFIYSVAPDGFTSRVRVFRFNGGPDPEFIVDFTGDATFLYLRHFRNGNQDLVAAEKDLANDTVLAAQIGDTSGPTVADATHVYWWDDGSLKRIAKGGGTPEVFLTAQTFPLPYAMDEENVFIVIDGNLVAVNKATRTRRTLATIEFAPVSVSVDGDYVYVTTSRMVERVLKTGSAPEIAATPAPGYLVFESAVVAGGVIFAIEAPPQSGNGCSNAALIAHTGAGTRVVSTRPGALSADECGVLHVPMDCFLVPLTAPFVAERFCALSPQRRRAVRK